MTEPDTAKTASTANFRRLEFSVDAALLRELGERLVGAPHVALAELIKNGYDADATRCLVRIHHNKIEISDNGHGMTFTELRNFWMRVGSPHKQDQHLSRHFRRPLTGSKGVGRLAVQFLAQSMTLETRSDQKDATGIRVSIDWTTAVKAGDLQEATADCWTNVDVDKFPENSDHGVRIILYDLNQTWDSQSIKNLARQVWMLRPPEHFFGIRNRSQKADFDIELETPNQEALDEFYYWQQAVFGRWIARVRGRIHNGRETNTEEVHVEFKEKQSNEIEEHHFETFPVSSDRTPCRVNYAEWQILIFNLSGHMGGKIKVDDVRDYFQRFGGVGLYDETFRLPYYGPDQDWLGIELDHSHRRVRSKLLPDEMHEERALNELPTQGRILGAVFVSTAQEASHAPDSTGSHSAETAPQEYLRIQVTRDRLVWNQAYQQLRDAVRRSLDWYAVLARQRRLRTARESRPNESPTSKLEQLNTVISAYEDRLPAEARNDIVHAVNDYVSTAEKEQEYRDALMGLVGPLASAGMAALAVEHETALVLRQMKQLTKAIESESKKHDSQRLFRISTDLKGWIGKIEESRAIFGPLLSREDREEIDTYKLHPLAKQVLNSLTYYLGRIDTEVDINQELRLPRGTYAEWHALLQNVIVNAVNAMDHAEQRKLRISGGTGPGRKAWFRVSDTGQGIDLDQAEQYFAPFRRGGVPVRELGLGGTGLGLTIVRMIAEQRNCRVAFVQPDPGFNTTFECSWTH